MAFAEAYRRQVELLVRILPAVAAQDCFALKGGTAINLFVRDLPRLSVDLDLTYLPVEDRATSLRAIDAAMARMADRIARTVRGARALPSRSGEGTITKLVVRAEDVQVKVEMTPVLRGCVFEPELRAVSPTVEDAFGFAETRVVSFADLYAGKIVAALDRQHPRDLFDVRDLLAHEGVGEALRRAVLVYLASHDRPVHEVLDARRKDLGPEFARGFAGMTREPVSLDALLAAQDELIAQVVRAMPDAHRRLLLAFERGEAGWRDHWAALGLGAAADLPAVRWRRQNLDRLDAGRRADLAARLGAVLHPPAPSPPPRPAPRRGGPSFGP